MLTRNQVVRKGPYSWWSRRLNAVLRGDHVDSSCVMHAERITDKERGTDSAQLATLTTHEAHALAQLVWNLHQLAIIPPGGSRIWSGRGAAIRSRTSGQASRVAACGKQEMVSADCLCGDQMFSVAAKMAATDRSTSASVVRQLDTAMRMRRWPCQVVAPIQHSPERWTFSMTRSVRSSSPKPTRT